MLLNAQTKSSRGLAGSQANASLKATTRSKMARPSHGPAGQLRALLLACVCSAAFGSLTVSRACAPRAHTHPPAAAPLRLAMCPLFWTRFKNTPFRFLCVTPVLLAPSICPWLACSPRCAPCVCACVPVALRLPACLQLNRPRKTRSERFSFGTAKSPAALMFSRECLLFESRRQYSPAECRRPPAQANLPGARLSSPPAALPALWIALRFPLPPHVF